MEEENAMKGLKFIIYCFIAFGVALPAFSAEFAFHGDMNHRFLLYTNRADWLDAGTDHSGVINKGEVKDNYGELKYRFWFEAASNDGNTKGVYAIEVGGIRFGEQGSGKGAGGSFSGDAVNVETRWAYLDWQVPGVESKARFKMGLQPFKVNRYLWQETIAGVDFSGATGNPIGYQLAWMRGVDEIRRDPTNNMRDQDNLLARVNLTPSDDVKVGLFGLWQFGQPPSSAPLGTITPRTYEVKRFADEVNLDILTLGVDGGANFGDIFVNWDLMVQTGDFQDVTFDDSEFSGFTTSGDFDHSAYFLHFDVGLKSGKNKYTFTFWNASGDDDALDKDFEAFISTDVDIDDAIGIFEGLYSDDNMYFTERPYMLDKGFIMVKLALDRQATEKTKYGVAGMYMLTAEDIEYTDFSGKSQKNDEIGWEIDVYLKHMLYKNLEFAINFGYLFASDALDAFEVGSLKDGSSDEDIFGSSMRFRYKF
jgi:hypothetical protein